MGVFTLALHSFTFFTACFGGFASKFVASLNFDFFIFKYPIMQRQKIYGLIFIAFIVNCSIGFSQGTFVLKPNFTELKDFYLSNADKRAREVRQDNELERNESKQTVNFDANPLMLNGKQLDYSRFSMGSKGVLTVVRGNPNTKEATPILFYVSIRHEGKIVVDKTMRFANKPLSKINLSEIFPFTQGDDLLIIKPVLAEHWKAKRILKLIIDGC